MDAADGRGAGDGRPQLIHVLGEPGGRALGAKMTARRIPLLVLLLCACRSASPVAVKPYAPPATYEPTSDVLERRDLPVAPEDLRILERADAILADIGRWDRNDDRVCSPGDTTWSLFCALQRASVEVLGTYDHRRAALQEVRFAIEAAAPDRRFEHRLQGYNNLDTTTFDDVKAVLRVARQRVAERLQSK